MGHNGCLMFCHITADEEGRVSRCHGATSKSGFPTIQASSCAQHPSPALKLPGTTVYHLTTWYKFIMDNAFPIKKNNNNNSQQHLDL